MPCKPVARLGDAVANVLLTTTRANIKLVAPVVSYIMGVVLNVLQVTTTMCLKKNIPDILDRNLKTIKKLSDFDISNTTCYQMTIQFLISPNVCFCTTKGKHNQQNSTFYPMRYNCLINVTRKNIFCSHFWHFGWHFIQLSIFHLPVVKLLEVLAHYANTSKETLSPFIDSIIDNVLL